MKQQFHRGDLVLYMDHWNEGQVYGIILGSYRDQYGGGPDQRHSYTVLELNNLGEAVGKWAWLEDEEIEYLVEARCEDHLDFIDQYEENEEDDEDWND